MTTDVAFWDKIAPKYSKSPISNVPAYEETLARVRTYLGADSRVLELGCGVGVTCRLLTTSYVLLRVYSQMPPDSPGFTRAVAM